MVSDALPIELPETGPRAGVATVVLTQPGRPVVVLDAKLFDQLEHALGRVPRGVRGVVIASAAERAFVAGADLKSIREWDDTRLDAYLANGQRVFGMIAALPAPTAAAIHAAVLGGGLELAMHCDGLIAAPPASGARPYPVGLPEAGLGLCPGWGGTNLLPARMDAAEAIRRTAAGRAMTFDEARAAGFFDAIAPDGASLRQIAAEWVLAQPAPVRDGAPSRWIGRAGRVDATRTGLDAVRSEVSMSEPGAAVAACVGAGIARGWRAALDEERTRLVALRHTDAAKAAIDAFFAKSAGKG